ncbi:arginine--tRNA ligase, partial [Candidatus Woesearchaeota archaeon CG10_big_fil_rev_8_21_14_0_10_32_9]
MKEKIAEILSKETKIPSEEIITQIEIPPDDSMGDYSFPCFMLARTMKKAPKAIAEELAAKIKTSSEIEKIDSVNGYLNFHINKTWLISNILKEILIKEQKFGVQNIGKNKIVLVEMSAPNIAKAFGIGHLRSTMIG